MIHGHTDDVGAKDKNFLLGYERACAVYEEIRTLLKGGARSRRLVHARGQHGVDSTARPKDRAVLDQARAKNRRITIEDLVVATSRPSAEARRDRAQEPRGDALGAALVAIAAFRGVLAPAISRR